MKEFEKYEIMVFFKDEEVPIVIEASSFIIGRSQKAEVSLSFDLVSREHLKISLKGEEVFIEELGSSNGTWLNGIKLKEKIKYLYENDSRIILGSIKGPVVLIKCFFKKDIKILSDLGIEKQEQSVNKSNIIILPHKMSENNKLVVNPSAKLASGDYEYRSSLPAKTKNDRVDKTIVEPNLILQMKNILSIEAQKTLKKSEKEADKIVNEAQQEASLLRKKSQDESNDIFSRANVEIENNKLIAYKEIKSLTIDASSEAERILKKTSVEIDKIHLAVKDESDEIIKVASDRAKDLTLTARKIAEELTQKSRKDADDLQQITISEISDLKLTASNESAVIRLSAQVFSEEIISKAHEKATKHLKDTEYIIQLKQDEDSRVEEENKKNIKKLNEVLQDLKNKTDDLKHLEFEAQNNYNSLTKGFEKEQVRISIERTSLEELRKDLSDVKNKLEKKILDLRLEEKNVNLQFETTLLEHKVLVAQTIAEVQQAQISKDSLVLEISFLKNEKERVGHVVKEIELDIIHKKQNIDQVAKDEASALHELSKTKELRNDILLEISREKNNLIIAKEKLNFEEQEVAEKFKNVQDYSDKTAEKIKLDYIDFENKKNEMINQLQLERNKQLKDLDNEVERVKDLNSKEIIMLISKKDELLLGFVNTEKESRLAFEQNINKINQESQVIQKVHKDEVEKQRINTQNRLVQMKNKFNELSAQLTKEHTDLQKTLSTDIARMTASKNGLEKELKLIESNRNGRIINIDKEVKDYQLNAKIKMDSTIKNIKDETVELQQNLAKMKEDEVKALAEFRENEINSLNILKENTLKDLHGKKSEKAKAVAINVGAILLTHLNTFRNRKINDLFIEVFSKEIDAIVYDTLMNRIEADREKLELAIKNKDEVRKKSILMKKNLLWTLVLFMVMAFFIFYPQLQAMPEFKFVKIFIDDNILIKF